MRQYPQIIDPSKYEHLWEWGAPYLIANLDVESLSDNGRWDFISYGVSGKTVLYISSFDRNILSEVSFSTYYRKYDGYEMKTREKMREVKKSLALMKMNRLKLLANNDLADELSKYLRLIRSINRNYGVTECYCTDKVERVLVEKPKRYDLDILKRNTERMGKLKLEQRELYNTLSDYKTGVLASLLREIEIRFKLDYKPTQYSFIELINILKGNKVIINNRQIWIKGKFSLWQDVLGKDAKSLIKMFTHIDRNIDVISGTISSKGKYIGLVRKIDFNIETNYFREISKMKLGEVLVSGSTGPELVLACKKAGAIITEEGGVISHAAIISRELRIPCITGTHIACKVLQTGDLVEVDAFNGIIKILKRKNGK